MNWKILELDLQQALRTVSADYRPEKRIHLEVSPSREMDFFSSIAFFLAKIKGEDPVLIAQRLLENWPERNGYRIENRRGFLYFFCSELKLASEHQFPLEQLEIPSALIVNPANGLSSLRLGCLLLFFQRICRHICPIVKSSEIYLTGPDAYCEFKSFAIPTRQIAACNISEHDLILVFDLLNSNICRKLLASYGHAPFFFPLRDLPDRRWLVEDLEFDVGDFQRILNARVVELIWYMSSPLGADELNLQVPGFCEADNLYWLLQSVIRRIRNQESFCKFQDFEQARFMPETAGREHALLAMQIELQILRAAYYAEVIMLLSLVKQSLRQLILLLNTVPFHTSSREGKSNFERIAVWKSLEQLESLQAIFSERDSSINFF